MKMNRCQSTGRVRLVSDKDMDLDGRRESVKLERLSGTGCGPAGFPRNTV